MWAKPPVSKARVKHIQKEEDMKALMNVILFAFAASLLVVVACDDEGVETEWAPQVLLQLTETDEVEPLNTAVSAVRERGFDAVVLVDGGFAEAQCERLNELDSQGFEVMQFIRPSEDGEDTVMSALTREEQRAALTNGKGAIEACLDRPVEGIRMTHFDQNQATYDLVDQLDYTYNLGFVAHSASSLEGHRDDVLPYQVDEYEFWAVPMHSVELEGDVKAFCDKPMSSLSPDQWLELMIEEFETTDGAERPLLVEIHPSFLVPQTDRFEAFTSFLDYAEGQGAEAMTVEEYVEWTASQR